MFLYTKNTYKLINQIIDCVFQHSFCINYELQQSKLNY
jgi:hypothetical protein